MPRRPALFQPCKKRLFRTGPLALLLGLTLGFSACHRPLPPAEPREASEDSLAKLRTHALNRVEQLSRRLELERGLPFKRPVKVEVQRLADFRAYVEQQLDRSLTPELAKAQSTALQALGLLPEQFDMRQALTDMVVSQAGAYYDPETETFYMLMAELSQANLDTIMIHELQHALQDQYFDLKKLQAVQQAEPNEDKRSAISFILEGEATYIMLRYQLKEAGQDISLLPAATQDLVFKMVQNTSRKSIQQSLAVSAKEQAHSQDLKRAMESTLELPSILLWGLYDPYMKGQYAIHSAYAAGGWDGVATLYHQPPTSTEQLLHPVAPGTPRDEPTDLTPHALDALVGSELAAPYRRVYANTLGEAGLMAFFDHHLKRPEEQASSGWDGDTYAVFVREDGQGLLVWQTVWDSERDAQEFRGVIQKGVMQKELIAVPGKKAPSRGALGPGTGERISRLLQEGNSVTILAGIAPLVLAAEKTLTGADQQQPGLQPANRSHAKDLQGRAAGQ